MFPTYSRMKDSGVKWLGRVPDNWRVKRLKDVVLVNAEALPETTDPEMVIQYVDIGNVQEGEDAGTPQEVTFFNAPSRARRIVRTGDTIISTVRTYLKAVAHFEDPPDNLIASTGFAVLSPGRDLAKRFLFYLVRSEEFIQRVVAHSVGVSYPAINQSELAGLPAWIPSFSEQESIASFLDRKTALIDDLIAKRKRQIELLQEQRTALISRAVTKGLNPDVPMKDSGVEWLGEVPEHWGVIPLKWRARCSSGDSLQVDDVTQVPEIGRQTPAIGGNGVMGYTDKVNIVTPVLVIGRVGALCGNVHRISPPAWVTDNALILDADSRVFEYSYLHAVLLSRNLNNLAAKTAQPLITGSQVRDQRLPCPPLSEQLAITSFLDRETAKIDTFVAKVQLSIEKLKEYRQSLISAVVTGKIDVRGHAAYGTSLEVPA